MVFTVSCYHAAPENDNQAKAISERPFKEDPPTVYVAKVKDLLLGLPPTADEVHAVTTNPDALRDLIEHWIHEPQYREKMISFFQIAFQQTQISADDFFDMLPGYGLGPGTKIPRLVQNVEESLARTAIVLIEQGLPLNQLINTRQLMMTPPLMELYAFLDTIRVDDHAKVNDLFSLMTNNTPVSIGSVGTPIALEDSLNPASENYMHFYDPGVATIKWPDPSCAMDPIVFPAPVNAYVLHNWLMGMLQMRAFISPTGVTCSTPNAKAQAAPFSADDFSNWKMVTLRAPRPGEAVTKFWDVPALKKANELVLQTPRVGFFSTPAFFANWPTNQNNQMRVTINQTLIVATGRAVDGNDPTTPTLTPGLDDAHAAAGGLCFSCHKLLDPTRSIFASTYSAGYSPQTNATYMDQKGLFAFQGVIRPVANIDDFAQTLATHPLFAEAWTQKLCYWANSAPCDPNDPEFQRVVNNFIASDFQWNVLVKDLLSSSMTTNAVRTKTAQTNGQIVSISRREHFCAKINNRLNLNDICGLNATDLQNVNSFQQIVGGLPADGYSRGSTIPVLANQPTMFYRAGVENICEVVATRVIDGGNKKWSSTQPDAAIADFVSLMLGFTSMDPRATQATQILKNHFNEANKNRENASTALKSTFVTACLSPSFIGTGL